MLILAHHEGDMAVSVLYHYGVIVSTGSACLSGADKPSHVATAMVVPFSEARNALRVSFSQKNTASNLNYVIQTFSQILA